MNNDISSGGTVRISPHDKPAQGTQRFDPHAHSQADEPTQFPTPSSGIGTQRLDSHNNNAPSSGTVRKESPAETVADNNRLHRSSGARRSSRKIPWGPVLTAVIGVAVVLIIALFTIFDDVWYRIQ